MFLVAINMETQLSSSSATAGGGGVIPNYSKKKIFGPKLLITNLSFLPKKTTQPHNFLSLISTTTFSSSSNISTSTTVVVRAQPTLTSPNSVTTNNTNNRHWMVIMALPQELTSTKSHIIDHYVSTLQRVLPSEKDAQMCIYHASCDSDTHFGFCCDIDQQTALQLASIPGVLSVKADPDFDSIKKDYSYSNFELSTQLSPLTASPLLFPTGTAKHWLVRMDRPSVGAIRKPQVVDYYVQVLIRVLGNEKDAQMCIYHISWECNYGFCCELDDEYARELAAVPGVLSVQPDENFESDDKDYGGENLKKLRDLEDSSASTLTSNIKTKKLFVTGLSFYTSEKTLRAAFEGFGEIVEVKIIMDKISKRSKGYAFVEYTSEEAASTALREMNGKIINGWMITVDVAKMNPPKYSRGKPIFTS